MIKAIIIAWKLTEARNSLSWNAQVDRIFHIISEGSQIPAPKKKKKKNLPETLTSHLALQHFSVTDWDLDLFTVFSILSTGPANKQLLESKACCWPDVLGKNGEMREVIFKNKKKVCLCHARKKKIGL